MLTFDHLLNQNNIQHLVFRPLSPQIVEPITVVWKKNTVLSKVSQLFIKRLKTSLQK